MGKQGQSKRGCRRLRLDEQGQGRWTQGSVDVQVRSLVLCWVQED